MTRSRRIAETSEEDIILQVSWTLPFYITGTRSGRSTQYILLVSFAVYFRLN